MSLKNILSKKNRALLRELVITDFKLRYQGSVLGYLWSLLKPLFLFAILYVVFGQLLHIGSNIEHFPVYLLLGVVLWGFFVEATSQGLQAIVARGDLIRKINFPKYIIVVSATVSALINLLLNLAVVLFFIVVNGVHLTPAALLFPLIVLELYAFALTLAFLLAAAFVRFRDISHIWEVGLQAAFYATPILYPVSEVISRSSWAAKVIMLNPLAQMIQDARHTLITPQATTLYDVVGAHWYVVVPFVVVVGMAILAGLYFKSSSRYFAENI